MCMTIRPAYLSHPLAVLIIIIYLSLGINLGGVEGFLLMLPAACVYGLLLFSIRGQKYMFKHGYLCHKRWYGPEVSIALSSIQYPIYRG
jgi:hypothetical protein